MSTLTSERLIGAVVALIGFTYAFHAFSNYDLGTLRRIGPGMFPIGLGATMTLLGVGIAIVAPDRDCETPDFKSIPLAFVMASIAAFALGIVFFGLFPAVILCVLIASLANRPFRPLGAAGTAALLCLFAWLIFKVALGLTIPLFRMPF